MSDSFREVSRVSWFGRLRNSVMGVLIGLLLIIAMVVLALYMPLFELSSVVGAR